MDMDKEEHAARSARQPRDVLENRDAMDSIERQKEGWANDAYEQFVQNGGLERLAGIGKPLVVPTDDVLDTILRNANVDPPWIMLKKEIGSNMAKVIQLLDKTPAAPEIDALLSELNKQIIELNALAPSRSLHRHLISRHNVREQYQRWYVK